jgi:hypothetical protein
MYNTISIIFILTVVILYFIIIKEMKSIEINSKLNKDNRLFNFMLATIKPLKKLYITNNIIEGNKLLKLFLIEIDYLIVNNLLIIDEKNKILNNIMDLRNLIISLSLYYGEQRLLIEKIIDKLNDN